MKKVLFIAYFFPPLGWSGVQRSIKFVKYLRHFGWEPVVITVGKSRFALKDDTLSKEIPDNIEVIRIDDILLKEYTDNFKEQMLGLIKPTFNVIKDVSINHEFERVLEEQMESVRSSLFIPDGCILWAEKVIQKVMSEINPNDYSLIYSTSGPYSDHLIGYCLKEQLHIPWVADFRDEWTKNPYFGFDQTSLKYQMIKRMEKNIVNFADIIITTTEPARVNFIENYNLLKEKVCTITNGYDEDDFKEIKSYTNDKFMVVHNGSFYSIRNPYTIITAVNNLVNKGLIDKAKFSLKIIGKCSDDIIKETQNIDIYNLVEWRPYLVHSECLEIAANADLLLLVAGGPEIPGKIFEYLRMGKPILSISPIGSAIDQLLELTGQGRNIAYENIEEIEEFLLLNYHNWANGKSIFYQNSDTIKQFERKNLTNILVTIFNSLT